jgi:alanine dehydrogenase
MIVKVKEPQPHECAMLHRDQALFTYLHLAADEKQARGLLDSRCTAIAYETVTDDQGQLPLLKPMSEVAGRMSMQVGACCLQRSHGGAGLLLGGITGVAPAKVLIIGGGVAGTNAAEIACGMRADVTVVDVSLPRLEFLDKLFQGRLKTEYSSSATLERLVANADLVIGAVLLRGDRAPKLISRDLVRAMKRGAVIVDIAIDQGGCCATSRPTTHADPTYEVDGVIHYCVANMPGAVPRTSTYGLNAATLPFVRDIADLGWRRAIQDDQHLANGLTVCDGKIVHPVVAAALSYLSG